MESAARGMVSTSALIPARNAADQLIDCVASILRQSRPPDEIVIVVGPSTDDTRQVASGLAGQTIRVLDNPAGDRGSGLNIGLSATTAAVIAMVDAQSRLDPDYFERALAALDSSRADVVGGPMRPMGRTAVGRALALALTSPFGIGDSRFHFAGEGREVESVYLGLYRRAVFDRVGRYNAALLRTEDDDLNARAREAGMRIWLDPAIRSVYLCRNDLPSIWRQYFGYGFWKIALATVRPGALRFRHAVPALFAVGVVGAAVVSALVWSPAFPLLVAAYLTTAWSVSASAKGGLLDRALLPLVTVTMHLSYGLGSILALPVLPSLARRARDGARASTGRETKSEHPGS